MCTVRARIPTQSTLRLATAPRAAVLRSPASVRSVRSVATLRCTSISAPPLTLRLPQLSLRSLGATRKGLGGRSSLKVPTTSPYRLPVAYLRQYATAAPSPNPAASAPPPPPTPEEELFMTPAERAKAKELQREKRYASNEQPLFYPIGIPRLIVMSVTTFGFYDFIWFYRQWKTFSKATKAEMKPLARSFLMFLYFHGLAKRVAYFCASHNLQQPKPLSLTIAFLVLSALWLRPLTWIPLVALQARMNEFNAKTAQKAPKNTKFTIPELAYLGVVCTLVLVQLAMGL